MLEYKKYFLTLITISIPLIIGNVSHILIGVIDVMVAARHSTQTIAAISIANAIMTCVFIAGIGLMSGITPVISNYLGNNKKSKKYLLSTINYSLILAAIISSVTIICLPLIDKIGFETELVPIIKQYIFIVAFSNFGGYLHFALKEFLQAYEVLTFPNILSVIAIFLNLILNITLVFGFGFIPAFGATGLALATLIVRTIMGLILLVYCFKAINVNIKFEKTYIHQLIKVGTPISVAMILEFFAFNSVTVLMGKISGIYAAAQGIIITITSLTFMVPLAISNAIAIKVGFANGARNYLDIKKYSLAGCGMTFLFMFICAIILLIFNKPILQLYTLDEQLINIAIPILIVAGIFQIFDGLQVAFSGILKGLKRTVFVTIAIICGYWLLGLPLGAFMAYILHLQLLGFWIGFAVSIFAMCIFMGTVLLFMFNKLKIKYYEIISLHTPH